MSNSSEAGRRKVYSLSERRRGKVRLVQPANQAGGSAAARAKPKARRTAWGGGFVEAIRRNRRVAAGAFAAVFVPVLLWVFLAPPVYETELRLLVKRETAGAVSSAGGGPVTQQEVASETELLRSRELLEQVALRRGLVAVDGGEAELARTVRQLQESLDVRAVPDTNVIALRYAGHDPGRAAELLNALAVLYLAKRAALEGHGEALQFFQEQAVYRGGELEQAQQAMSEFARGNQVSLLEKQKEAALRRVEELEIELASVRGEIQAGKRRMSQLLRQGRELPRTIKTKSRSARNQTLIEKLKGMMVDLESQRTELLTRYEPGYRLVVEVEKKIADTQATLRREEQAVVVDETEALNPIRQSVEAEYFRTQTQVAGLEARHRELARGLSEQRGRQMSLERFTAEHDTLRRKLRLAEENYLRYEERKEQARIAHAFDVEQLRVSIVEPAREPAAPAIGYDAMVVVLGLLLASCSGAGAAMARDWQYRAVANAAEIADLTGLPVLSTSVVKRR